MVGYYSLRPRTVHPPWCVFMDGSIRSTSTRFTACQENPSADTHFLVFYRNIATSMLNADVQRSLGMLCDWLAALLLVSPPSQVSANPLRVEAVTWHLVSEAIVARATPINIHLVTVVEQRPCRREYHVARLALTRNNKPWPNGGAMTLVGCCLCRAWSHVQRCPSCGMPMFHLQCH